MGSITVWVSRSGVKNTALILCPIACFCVEPLMPKGSSFPPTDWGGVAASSMGKKQLLMELVQTKQAIWGKRVFSPCH